jgi:hypothetical protein
MKASEKNELFLNKLLWQYNTANLNSVAKCYKGDKITLNMFYNLG